MVRLGRRSNIFHLGDHNRQKITALSVTLAAIAIVALTLGLVFVFGRPDKRPPIVGAIVSNGKQCADIGTKILYDGGTAIDAAIATLLCEGIMLPYSMGIGGGFIATVYTKSNRKIETITARETAPAAAHKYMFVGKKTITGAIAGAVPGEILGYWEMHQRHGRLPWKVLFEPTIKLCRDGFWVSQHMGLTLKYKEQEVRRALTLAEVFVKKDGSLYKEGDHMKLMALGDTLEKIAKNGAGEMYDGGETGKMFTEDIQKMGGIITEKDFKNYKVVWHDTTHVEANVTGGYKLYTTPLPSSGALLVFILNVMSELYTKDVNLFWHRAIETYKHAYGQRTHLGDMENDPKMRAIIKETYDKLLSKNFTNYVRQLVHDDRTFIDVSYYGANFTIEEDHGTANIAVLAPNGDAITVTSTVNSFFGAKVRSSRTGIILNDEMDDFSTMGIINSYGVHASPTNYIKPGKRPMSSMCPAIILDAEGNVRMLVGAAGGTKITTSVAAAIMKYLILNDTLKQAVNDGRLHHQLAPMQVDAEDEVSPALRKYLKRLGHKVKVLGPGTGFGALTAIGVRDGEPEPIFDRRRGGSTSTIHRTYKMQH